MKTISIVLLLVVSSFVSLAQKEIIQINKQKFEVDTSLNFDLKGYWECFYVEEYDSDKIHDQVFESYVVVDQTKKLNEFLKDKKIYDCPLLIPSCF